jgi:hypothetical protein
MKTNLLINTVWLTEPESYIGFLRSVCRLWLNVERRTETPKGNEILANNACQISCFCNSDCCFSSGCIAMRTSRSRDTSGRGDALTSSVCGEIPPASEGVSSPIVQTTTGFAFESRNTVLSEYCPIGCFRDLCHDRIVCAEIVGVLGAAESEESYLRAIDAKIQTLRKGLPIRPPKRHPLLLRAAPVCAKRIKVKGRFTRVIWDSPHHFGFCVDQGEMALRI